MQWSEAIQPYLKALKPIEITESVKQRLIPFIDYTNLTDEKEEDAIAEFCAKAKTPYGNVAAVCLYPTFVRLAYNFFSHTPIKVATVANFPEGDDSLEAVLIAINAAITDGAQEIDVVFPYRRYLAGEKHYAHDFIAACKSACQTVTLKVILETGILNDLALIADASFDAFTAGADFIKTSTGKVSVGATLEAAATMLLVIAHLKSKLPQHTLGLKVAGGIKDWQQATNYLQLAEDILGKTWPTQKTFRIGTSRLIV